MPSNVACEWAVLHFSPHPPRPGASPHPVGLIWYEESHRNFEESYVVKAYQIQNTHRQLAHYNWLRMMSIRNITILSI
jgi:hypothetical protein